jgi:hypothetical protein
MPKKYQHVIFFKLRRTYPTETSEIHYSDIELWFIQSVIDGFITEDDIEITHTSLISSPNNKSFPEGGL